MTTIEFNYSKIFIDQEGQLCVHGYEYLTYDDKRFRSIDPQFTPIQSSPSLPPLRSIVTHSHNQSNCSITALTQSNQHINIDVIDGKVSYNVLDEGCLIVDYDIILTTSGQAVFSGCDPVPELSQSKIRWIGSYDGCDGYEVVIVLIDDQFYRFNNDKLTLIGEVKDIKTIRDCIVIDKLGYAYSFFEIRGAIELDELSSCVDACRHKGDAYLLDDRGDIRKYREKYHEFAESSEWESIQYIESGMKMKRLVGSDIISGYGVIAESEDGDYYQIDGSSLKKIELPKLHSSRINEMII